MLSYPCGAALAHTMHINTGILYIFTHVPHTSRHAQYEALSCVLRLSSKKIVRYKVIQGSYDREKVKVVTNPVISNTIFVTV